jgi:hypothetical protein
VKRFNFGVALKLVRVALPILFRLVLPVTIEVAANAPLYFMLAADEPMSLVDIEHKAVPLARRADAIGRVTESSLAVFETDDLAHHSPPFA